jgi:hypothetical protein
MIQSKSPAAIPISKARPRGRHDEIAGDYRDGEEVHDEGREVRKLSASALERMQANVNANHIRQLRRVLIPFRQISY